MEISDTGAIEARRIQERSEALIREQEVREVNRKHLLEKQKFESLLGKLRLSSEEAVRALSGGGVRRDPKVLQQELRERIKDLGQKHEKLDVQRQALESSQDLQIKALERFELSKKRLEMIDEICLSLRVRKKTHDEMLRGEELVESVVSCPETLSRSVREEDRDIDLSSRQEDGDFSCVDMTTREILSPCDLTETNSRSSSEYLPSEKRGHATELAPEPGSSRRAEVEHSAESLAERVVEIWNGRENGQQSIEVKMKSRDGVPFAFTVTGAEEGKVSVLIRIESPTEYFSVLGRRSEISRMLEERGLSLKDLSVERERSFQWKR